MPRILKADIRALYAATIQRREHLATMINTIMGFAVTINAVVLTLIADFIGTNGFHPGFIFVGGALAAATVAGWRLYTRYLDDNIASLYSEIFYYEIKLGIPKNMGIDKYLRKYGNVKYESLDKNTIEKLYEEKQLGSRGHRKIEQLSLAYVCALLGIELVVLFVYSSPMNLFKSFVGMTYLACLLITIASIVILSYSKWRYQTACKN